MSSSLSQVRVRAQELKLSLSDDSYNEFLSVARNGVEELKNVTLEQSVEVLQSLSEFVRLTRYKKPTQSRRQLNVRTVAIEFQKAKRFKRDNDSTWMFI